MPSSQSAEEIAQIPAKLIQDELQKYHTPVDEKQHTIVLRESRWGSSAENF